MSVAARQIPRSYDPEKAGAQCSRCLLRSRPCVPPELREGTDTLIVGEYARKDDVEQERVFVGSSGQELLIALKPYAERRELSLTNAVLCNPNKGDLEAVQRETKKLVKAGHDLLDPVVACKGRLEAELLQFPNVMPLGAVAVEAVLGKDASVMGVRGRPMVVGPHRVLASLHPSFVLRASRWRHIFRGDVARAFRLFSGALDWRMPAVMLNPPVALLEQWLARATAVVVDIETDGIESLTCNLRCIGLARLRNDGTVHQTVVVGWERIDKAGGGFYAEKEMPALTRVICEFLTNKNILKIGHNLGYFDNAVLRRVFDIDEVVPYQDTILLHRACESELPHSLGFIGSAYTDVQAWKDVRNALDYENDEELHRYCATDVAVTGVVYASLDQNVDLRAQRRVVEMDHRVQVLCRDMHAVGMGIDPVELNKWSKKLEADRAHELHILKEGCARLWERSDFNPGSTQQCADLIFGERSSKSWGIFCKREWYTDADAPSTDAETIRALMREPGLSSSQLKFLTHLRRYRRAVKFKSTFVDPILDKLSLLSRGAPLRIHPHWNAHVTVSGRLSSSSPNAQQVPFKLRSMFAAAKGHVLVGADMDQIELRYASAVAGASAYLEVFKALGDPHAVTASQIFGKLWLEVESAKAPEQDHKVGATCQCRFCKRKKFRDFAKKFSYACLYGAEDKTVYEILTGTEDSNGDFPYLKLSFEQTSQQRARWLGGNPQFRSWWSKTVAQWRRDTYLADQIVGRRRDFLDGENKNEQVNFPIQAGSAAIVHLNTFALLDAGIIPNFDGPGTGIIQQGHDALLVECKEEHGDEVRELVQKCMTRYVPVLKMNFTAAAKKGQRWTELS